MEVLGFLFQSRYASLVLVLGFRGSVGGVLIGVYLFCWLYHE